jgi:glycosyltransferase involved in cell wall biosynthesis
MLVTVSGPNAVNHSGALFQHREWPGIPARVLGVTYIDANVSRRHIAQRCAVHGPPYGTRSGVRRVLIDALAARYGGTAVATVQLARHLAARPDVSTVAVITRSGAIVEREVVGEEAVRCIALTAPHHLELAQRVAWEALRLPTIVRRERYDALISMSGILPRSPGCRLLCLLGNPVMYEINTPANLLRQWAARRTAGAAGYLAAPSRHMADMVSASVGRQCNVLPWGVDHGIFYPAPSPGEELLCVADFYKHKRHDLLLNAWHELEQPRPTLRLVGNPAVDHRTYAQVVKLAGKLGNGVLIEHGLTLAQLVAAYRRARVFVLPSEHESFCMPLAESMACGVPAVVRGIPSLRETGGTGAAYLDSDDPAEWAALMRRMIEDDTEHDRARILAMRAAARFTWDGLAEELAARL